MKINKLFIELFSSSFESGSSLSEQQTSNVNKTKNKYQQQTRARAEAAAFEANEQAITRIIVIMPKQNNNFKSQCNSHYALSQ